MRLLNESWASLIIGASNLRRRDGEDSVGGHPLTTGCAYGGAIPVGDYKIEATEVPALRFKQWLADWDTYASIKDAPGRKPSPYIHMFSMPAGTLRVLSDVYRRKRDQGGAEGIQRFQDRSRTAKIQRYVRFGYPYGDLPQAMRKPENDHLRKPGWLPTAIVINILKPGDKRRGRVMDEKKVVQIQDGEGYSKLLIPAIFGYTDSDLPPFEVIDGQHRLWAFDPENSATLIPDDFELPVVAYHGLALNWQAYLFWSINVSPKRINKSHAFDLYPLLRSQDWLDQVGEVTVYREARAQELTELLYSLEESPWYHRINMLGEKGGGSVTQSAWVRAMTASLLATGRGASRPGLFQAELGDDETSLGWSRGQQAAFLVTFWSDLKSAVTAGYRHNWIQAYGGPSAKPFEDKTSMLNQDMGVRALLSVLNDIFFAQAHAWRLDEWVVPSPEDADIKTEAKDALALIDAAPFRSNLRDIAAGLAAFDWRSFDAPGVKGGEDEQQEVLKRSFRGSGGYTALRIEVLKTLAEGYDEVAAAAREQIWALTAR
jgi:DGQHR domain-containing protein